MRWGRKGAEGGRGRGGGRGGVTYLAGARKDHHDGVGVVCKALDAVVRLRVDPGHGLHPNAQRSSEPQNIRGMFPEEHVRLPCAVWTSAWARQTTTMEETREAEGEFSLPCAYCIMLLENLVVSAKFVSLCKPAFTNVRFCHVYTNGI